ncbi:hypothetical protein CSA17_06200 [bacterium DOLJORAL78_65_58]|nr:MAG: hypothetical protein CSB20_07795 [bacterium DOLZORAL124_64_63]PIE75684.1 MAG: hypothetical protein CSA17_06200 [bacterium DOLJORAL78_65_58]
MSNKTRIPGCPEIILLLVGSLLTGLAQAEPAVVKIGVLAKRGTHDTVAHAVFNGPIDAGSVRSHITERMTMEAESAPADPRTISTDESHGETIHPDRSTRHYPEWPWLVGIVVLAALVLVAELRANRLKRQLRRTRELAEEKTRAWGFLKQILDTLPVGVILVETDNRTITMANPTATTMIGLDAEQIIGRPCNDFLCLDSAGHGPIPDQHSSEDHAEHLLRTRKQRDIPVLRTTVTVQIDGRPYQLASFLDISERKQAEADRERLAKAIDQAGEMILTTDRDGNIQYVNPAFERITGYSRNEVIGKKPTILNNTPYDEAFIHDIWETINRGETWTGRCENRRKNGTLFTDGFTITAVRDEDDEIVSFVSVGRDVTAQMELENQYQQAQKMETIGRLAGGLAHDYNNMMSVILGYTEMLLERNDLSEAARGEVQEIQNAAQRSAQLTAQLLGFARKQKIVPQPLDLSTVLENMSKMLTRLIGESIVLEFRPDPNSWPVHMDPTQVDQILVNLCINARDAMPKGGRVVIRTRNTRYPPNHTSLPPKQEPGDYLTLSVEDEGYGMSREVLDMAFEPFFTTKPKGQGTGLGLAMVYGIVRQNKGFIHIDSQVDRGTTVHVNLPRLETPTLATSGNHQEKRKQEGSETILLIEDEDALLMATSGILRMHGYTVLTASLPSEALDLFTKRGEEIDLVISDVVMPGMNGIELTKKLTAHRPGLPCLLVSGYTSDVVSGPDQLEEGIHFLQKPFSVAALMDKVRELLDA